MHLSTVLLLIAIGTYQIVSAKQCYVCTGVGMSESVSQTTAKKSTGFGDSFFDLSEFEESKTAEKDESMLAMDMCNNLKTQLPLTMLQTCPNPSDLCFIEKTVGKMEAALETLNEEDIVKLTSTQISRGCKSIADLPSTLEFTEPDGDMVPLAELAMENPKPFILTEEICEEVNTRGLIGTKCLTVCTLDGCNSSGSLTIMWATLISCLVFVYWS